MIIKTLSSSCVLIIISMRLDSVQCLEMGALVQVVMFGLLVACQVIVDAAAADCEPALPRLLCQACATCCLEDIH